jgi:hypothetical protein
MDAPIKNAEELKKEIARLKELKEEQSAAIKLRFSTTTSTLATIYSMFSGSTDADVARKGVFHLDMVSLLSRILLPITLNTTLFRNSGLIVKTLVGLFSQKASSYISEDSVSTIWDKAKSLYGNIADRLHKDTQKHKGAAAVH